MCAQSKKVSSFRNLPAKNSQKSVCFFFLPNKINSETIWMSCVHFQYICLNKMFFFLKIKLQVFLIVYIPIIPNLE